MDDTAILKIAELANSGAQLPEPLRDRATITIGAAHINSLERYMDTPLRFRGEFSTTRIKDLAAYLRNNPQEPVIFLGRESMSATAIFDRGTMGDPGWCEHQAMLALRPTPEYGAVLNKDVSALSQIGFQHFIEDWEDHITFWLDGQTMEFGTAIQRVRKVTIESARKTESSVGDFASSRSSMESIEIGSQRDKLPDSFTFAVTPYEGFISREINCRITVRTGGDKIGLAYRIMRREALIDSIADEFRTLIEQQCGNDAEIYIGNYTPGY